MARIRTIKPEFWQNEQLAKLSEHARLMAIALLNQADDQGCFLANHQLVRAACFPFEEHSKNVLGSLQELSRIGYIEIRNCSGKQIGRVCKFTDHQRIDKPQKSKLLDVFLANYEENDNSKNVPGTIQEHSGNTIRLEGNGKGMEREVERNGMEAIVAKVGDVFTTWNNSSSISKVRKLTDDRKAKLRLRLQDPDWPWEDAIAKLPIPNTDRFTWQPDFDWLIANDRNAYSLAEGKYDLKSEIHTQPKPRVMA